MYLIFLNPLEMCLDYLLFLNLSIYSRLKIKDYGNLILLNSFILAFMRLIGKS